MSRGTTVLIVDDDARIRELLAGEVGRLGCGVVTAIDGEEGIEQFRRAKPDLVLTDLAMPRRDGFDLIAAIRASSKVPVIVLSVRGHDDAKIRALDLGADDYVVKPFSLPELLARVRAQLRRVLQSAASPMLRFPGLEIDMERRRVLQGERELRLTPTELSILELLAQRAGRPVSIDEIIRRVWNDAPGTTYDTVRVHVRSLRRKIEPDPSEPQYIVTDPWVGYRFIAEPIG